jgi:Ca-activated chloride channel family protein
MGNFNDVLMEQMADKGNGQYFYIDTLDEARRIFVEKITGTLQVIAKDAKVQVDFNPDVVSQYRLIGYENRAIADQDFRNDSVDAGEIGAGISATALYVVELRPNVEGRMATVQLRWKDPDGEQAHEINGNVNTWDLSSSFEEADPRYQLAVAAGEYAEILRQSTYASWSSLASLATCTRRLAETLRSDPDVVEFANLVERASQNGE